MQSGTGISCRLSHVPQDPASWCYRGLVHRIQHWLNQSARAEEELVRETVKYLCFACRNPCWWQFGKTGLCWEGMNQRCIRDKGQSGQPHMMLLAVCQVYDQLPISLKRNCSPLSTHQTPRMCWSAEELTTMHVQNDPVFSAG